MIQPGPKYASCLWGELRSLWLKCDNNDSEEAKQVPWGIINAYTCRKMLCLRIFSEMFEILWIIKCQVYCLRMFSELQNYRTKITAVLLGQVSSSFCCVSLLLAQVWFSLFFAFTWSLYAFFLFSPNTNSKQERLKSFWGSSSLKQQSVPDLGHMRWRGQDRPVFLCCMSHTGAAPA